MMKKILITAIFMIILCITGCSGDAPVGNSHTKPAGSDDTSAMETKPGSEDTDRSSLKLSDPVIINETIVSVLKYFVDQDNNERMLYLNGQNQIILYDFATEKELCAYDLEKENGDMIESRLLSYSEDEFVLFVKTAQKQDMDNSAEGMKIYSGNSDSEQYEICIFDANLNLVKTYDLTELFPEVDGMYEYYGMCMNKDGSALVMYGEDTIYFYSLASGKRTQTDERIMEQLQNISIQEMAISADEKRIAFLGCELDHDEYSVYGVMDFSSGEVKIKHTANNYGNTLYESQDMVYITDGEIPHENSATGIILCINLEDGTISDFQVDNLESTAARLTDDQKYMVTVCNILSKDSNNIDGWQMKVYDFDKNEAVWQEELTQAGRLAGFDTAKDKVLVVIYEENSGYSIYRYNL